jgi:hypothetical protein
MNSRIEQLCQLIKPVWDGDLISKYDRDELYKAGYIDRVHGLNFLTKSGICILTDLAILKP